MEGSNSNDGGRSKSACQAFCDLLDRKQNRQNEIVLPYNKRNVDGDEVGWRRSNVYPMHDALIGRFKDLLKQPSKTKGFERARCTVKAAYESRNGAWQVLNHMGEGKLLSFEALVERDVDEQE